MLTMVELLRRAVAELKTDGWVQGDFHMGGKHCAIGAVEDALRAEYGVGSAGFGNDDGNGWFNSKGEELFNRTIELLDSRAREKGFDGTADFNDAKDTTFADVRSLFAEAISRAKKGTPVGV